MQACAAAIWPAISGSEVQRGVVPDVLAEKIEDDGAQEAHDLPIFVRGSSPLRASVSNSAAHITQHGMLLDLPEPVIRAFSSARVREVSPINELVQAYRARPEFRRLVQCLIKETIYLILILLCTVAVGADTTGITLARSPTLPPMRSKPCSCLCDVVRKALRRQPLRMRLGITSASGRAGNTIPTSAASCSGMIFRPAELC